MCNSSVERVPENSSWTSCTDSAGCVMSAIARRRPSIACARGASSAISASIANTRTLPRVSRRQKDSGWEHTCGQVTVTPITHNGHNDCIFELSRQAQRNMH